MTIRKIAYLLGISKSHVHRMLSKSGRLSAPAISGGTSGPENNSSAAQQIERGSTTIQRPTQIHNN
jgi:hypothetical protein